MFGHERVLASLSIHQKPIENAVIDERVRAYETAEVLKHPISYVVVLAESSFIFAHRSLV